MGVKCLDRNFIRNRQAEYYSHLVNLSINKISANLFSKAKTVLANAFGGGVSGLVPAYA